MYQAVLYRGKYLHTHLEVLEYEELQEHTTDVHHHCAGASSYNKHLHLFTAVYFFVSSPRTCSPQKAESADLLRCYAVTGGVFPGALNSQKLLAP
jgi:hypothetical protein